MTSRLEFTTAWHTARAIRSGELSSLDVTSALLTRIAAVNQNLGALVTILEETALDLARKADEAQARGESWGPLHGVPCTVKDTFEMAGVRTTAGVEELSNYAPRSDAAVVARLRAAGAIILGKTNTPPLGVDWQTYNDLFGVTNNPWDVTRTPGGSSGGCAAAVAAGLTCLSIGSDMGGSIRIPASFCGVYGHKPSLGLIPSTGHIPPLPGKPPSAGSLGVRGPLARDAVDLKLAMQVLGGAEAAESVAWNWRLPAARGVRLSDYRIGFQFEDSQCPVTGEVRGLLEAVVEALSRAGAQLAAGWPTRLIAEHQYKVYRSVALGRKAFRGSGRGPAQKLSKLIEELSPGASIDDWAALKKQLFSAKGAGLVARQLWQDYFRTHDAFLLPAVFTPAFLHDHSEPMDARSIATADGDQPYLNLPFWVSFATLAGLPATVAPIGLTPAGLPVGIQIVGPYLEDATPIELAGRIADLVGGFREPPESPVAGAG